MLISWNVTRECNLKCKHCYRDAGEKDSGELSFDEAKSLLDEIKLAGFRIIILSGGEPLMRPDIFNIISYANKIGLRPVLGSNGTLIDKNTARRLKDAGLARAGISLDSKIPEVHNEFRGTPRAYQETMQGIEALKEVGLDFQIHTTVSKYNYNEIESLIDYVEEIGAIAYHIFFLVPTGRGKEEIESMISVKQYYALILLILEQQKRRRIELKPVCAPQFVPIAEKKSLKLRFKRGCLAGISYCCILPNGDVHPCPYLPLNLGNVKEQKFSEIWRDNNVFNEMRRMEYKGKCAGCVYINSCGGCRARAFYYSCDYMGEDYYCNLGAENNIYFNKMAK